MKKTFLLIASVAIAAMFAIVACEKEPTTTDTPTDTTETPGATDTIVPPVEIPELTVSTDVQNRNVVIEEYTGVSCGYCPNGHAVVRVLMEQNPNRIFGINIHQGYYTTWKDGETYFTTSYGTPLASQTGLTGYPAATINRHVFSGSTMATSNTSEWQANSRTVMSESSCVNLAAQCVMDKESREMAIQVKGYYTSNSNTATNKLNVALLQNDVIGPQANYGNYNPSQYDSHGNYHHMHMLRKLLSGTWGVDMNATSAGSTFDTTFTYTLPDKIGNVQCVPEDMEIIVFMAEGRTNIITGTKAEIYIR